MTEMQPDMLGGKARPASSLPRRSIGKAPITRHGWADKPGTGPAGETCGSCTYCAEYRFKHTYLKCSARPGEHWKGGRETDIRPMDPACAKWSGRIKEVRPAPATPPAAPPAAAPPTPQATRKPDDERQSTFPWG